MKNIKIFVFSAFALVSTVIIRAIQLLFLTDFKTGFYKEGMETLGSGLMAFLVITITLASSLIFTSKTQRLISNPSSTLLSASMLFAGLANIVEPFFGSSSLSAVPVAFLGIRTILVVLSGFVFCYFAIAMLTERKPNSALSIVLVISWVARLMTSFICFSKMSNISENLYDILMLVFTLIFIHLFGKTVCGIGAGKTNKLLFASGIAAVLFSAASSIPFIIAQFFEQVKIVHTPTDNPITGLFMAFFISVYLVEISRENKAE